MPACSAGHRPLQGRYWQIREMRHGGRDPHLVSGPVFIKAHAGIVIQTGQFFQAGVVRRAGGLSPQVTLRRR